MAYQLQIRRGTAAQWVAANPTLGNGELGLEENTQLVKMGNGVDVWTALPYWPGGGAETERSYGRYAAIFNGDLYPLTVSMLEHRARLHGHWDLFSSFTYYADCRWRVVSGNNGVLGESLTFASTAEIVTYLNNNVDSSGAQFDESAFVHCYDVVDGSIAPVSTVYGKNAILSRLKQWSGGYWHTKTNVNAVREHSWAEDTSVLHALWLESWGTALAGAPATWTNNERQCFWWSANGKRMYDMPCVAAFAASNVSGGSGRYCKDAANNRIPASGHGFFWSSTRQPAYVAVTPSGVLSESFGLLSSMARISSEFAYGNSVLCGIPLESSFGEKAMFIKPVGIDQVYLSYVDTASYRIEFVGGANRDRNRRIRTSGAVFSNPNQGTGPIIIDKWLPACAHRAAQYHGHGPVPGRVSIQLRDLATNKVSVLSTAQIKWLHKKRLRPIACVVETRP